MIIAWIMFAAIVGGVLWLLLRQPKEPDAKEDEEQAEYIREWQRRKKK